jgi:hypothetical protein
LKGASAVTTFFGKSFFIPPTTQKQRPFLVTYIPKCRRTFHRALMSVPATDVIIQEIYRL